MIDENEVVSVLDRKGIAYTLLSCPGECPTTDSSSIMEVSFNDFFRKESLRDHLKGIEAIGIVVNDGERPTPTHLVLEQLLRNDPWVFDRVSRVVIATGSHKRTTEDDIRTILGKTYPHLAGKVHIHDGKDRSAHIPYGTTSRGTELFFDSALEDCEMLFLINSVEPHYFAGFTGGRKSILPGIALYETIEANHRFALSEGSKTAILDGNPVHEDMVEGAKMYMGKRRHLSFQMVQAPGIEITGLRIGELDLSFDMAVEDAKKLFCAPVDDYFDIVIAIAKPPMDRTLYQAQKAIEHGRSALRKGGVIILVSECAEGIGQSAFWDLLISSPDRETVMERIRKGYRLGYHKAARIAQLSAQSEIFMVSKIPPSTLARGFIKGFGSLEEAVTEALSIVGDDPKVLVIPDGTVTVPMVRV